MDVVEGGVGLRIRPYGRVMHGLARERGMGETIRDDCWMFVNLAGWKHAGCCDLGR